MLARTSSLPNHGKLSVVNDSRPETGLKRGGEKNGGETTIFFFSSQCMENEIFFLECGCTNELRQGVFFFPGMEWRSSTYHSATSDLVISLRDQVSG